MKRRKFISLLGGAAVWPVAVPAQQSPKSLRIGIVTIQQRTSPPYAAFDRRLRELGYIDGQNLAVEFLNPNTGAVGVVGAVRELVGRKVDVLIAPYESAVKSALEASDTTMIHSRWATSRRLLDREET